jgi:hypothetical protein
VNRDPRHESAPFSRLLIYPFAGTTAVKPTASFSAFVNPVTRLLLTYTPSFPRALTNATGG